MARTIMSRCDGWFAHECHAAHRRASPRIAAPTRDVVALGDARREATTVRSRAR